MSNQYSLQFNRATIEVIPTHNSDGDPVDGILIIPEDQDSLALEEARELAEDLEGLHAGQLSLTATLPYEPGEYDDA